MDVRHGQFVGLPRNSGQESSSPLEQRHLGTEQCGCGHHCGDLQALKQLTAGISARAGAFPLAVGSADSGISVTLPHGEYTAQVTPAVAEIITPPTTHVGDNHSTITAGDALVEIYEMHGPG
jgi:hypothetical protein